MKKYRAVLFDLFGTVALFNSEKLPLFEWNGQTSRSTLGGLRADAPAWSAYRMNHFQHLRVHVQSERIDGYAICGPASPGADGCVPGAVADSWSISTRKAAAPSPAGALQGRNDAGTAPATTSERGH